MLSDAREIAFLDVREHGQYGEGHPFFSVNCPYSLIEKKAAELVPNPAARVVLMDDGDGIALLAIRRLQTLGYGDVSILEGGAPAWAAAGFQLFKGVNVPSKAFGELVEHDMDTPSMSADELQRRLTEGEPIALFDGRTPAEYAKMNIPGAVSLPNAELGLRLPALLQDPLMPVVINCAGRTRSIIGAQTLLNLGFRNPIVALRNGTQGWQLAGHKLNHGATATPMPDLSPKELVQARTRYTAFVKANDLPVIDQTTLKKWREDRSRTTYLFDTRSDAEFNAGHVPGSCHAPGGQLVQATDLWIGVRNARVVLSDPLGLRAATTCFWLRRMGHDAYILDTDESDLSQRGADPDGASDNGGDFAAIAATALAAHLKNGAQLFDLSPGYEFRNGHIAQAKWAIRPRLKQQGIDTACPVILTSSDPALARLAAIDLVEMGIDAPLLLPHDPDEWRSAGLDIISTPSVPTDADMIDFLFFVHDRHSGVLESARRYLEWETGLIAQMDEDELQTFQTGPAAATSSP
ncbi:rhodanese-like domain-containing protein [Oceaniovalibus sp. ACAM 378]|uniref:rhodanese-like domain-containing protein n=1 Tax=Oceaniovalibus sp. ACAM 378 TaxID=2599923 RepID=UPI001CA33F5A